MADAAQSGGGAGEAWLVAKVCSEYIQYCERGLAAGSISQSHRNGAVTYLNDLCRYCGALPTAELKKAHVHEWMESHAGWRSTATIAACWRLSIGPKRCQASPIRSKA